MGKDYSYRNDSIEKEIKFITAFNQIQKTRFLRPFQMNQKSASPFLREFLRRDVSTSPAGLRRLELEDRKEGKKSWFDCPTIENSRKKVWESEGWTENVGRNLGEGADYVAKGFTHSSAFLKGLIRNNKMLRGCLFNKNWCMMWISDFVCSPERSI